MPDWLREVVGWAQQPDIGLVGLQLIDGDGTIQHGGVILGLEGFAGHLFQGMAPGEDSLLGSTALVPGRALGHRRVRRRATRPLRGDRWLRRALRPVRQRRGPRSGHDLPRPAERRPSPRRGAAPRVGHPWLQRSPRRLLREHLAVPEAPRRRRPVPLAEPLARDDPAHAPTARRSPGDGSSVRGSSVGPTASSVRRPTRRRSTGSHRSAVRTPRCDPRWKPGTPRGPATTTCARSTGSSPISTARSTAASTPRSGSPTSWPPITAWSTGSC